MEKNYFKRLAVIFLTAFCIIAGFAVSPEKAEAAAKLKLTFEFTDGSKKSWKSGDKKLDLGTKELAYVYYGSYPQTELTGAELTSKITAAKYDKNGIASVNGVKYKRIAKADTRFAVSSFIDSNYSWWGKDYAYFKFEPIKWRVVSDINGRVLLLSEYALDCRQYDSKGDTITWAESALRSWLNKDFLSEAFNSPEKKFLPTTKVVTPDSVFSSIVIEGGKDANDKVFLLSYEDLTNRNYGFSGSRTVYDMARRCASTDFTKAMGANISRGDDYITADGQATSSWPLRSPGMFSNKIYTVNGRGYIDVDYIVSAYYAVRPAISLDLKSVIALPDAKKDAKKTKLVLEYSDGTKQAWTNGDAQINLGDKEIAYVYYGSYPQTELTNYELTDSIVNAKYDKNGVAVVAGAKYKRISKKNSIGIDENDSSYYKWAGKKYAYFAYEPIKWNVLSNDNGNLMLLSEYGLSNNRYNEELASVSWAECTLRTWLNKSFITDAFNSKERKLIKTSSLKNEDNPEYGTAGGASTKDKLFLLSYSDIYNEDYGFATGGFVTAIKEYCLPTTYSRALGSSVFYSNRLSSNMDIPSSKWWLRTAGFESHYALARGTSGEKIGEGVLNPNTVRPAMVLNLTKVVGK